MKSLCINDCGVYESLMRMVINIYRQDYDVRNIFISILHLKNTYGLCTRHASIDLDRLD